jgi:hypothetical protein
MEAQREAGLMAKGGNPDGFNQYRRACGSDSDPQANEEDEPQTITLAGAGGAISLRDCHEAAGIVMDRQF